MKTEKQYLTEIKRKCNALGVWRDEFDSTRQRLAKIYVRIDQAETLFEKNGSEMMCEKQGSMGQVNTVRNPILAEIDLLYDQALTYEKELGLTAAALKKINESALHSKEDSPLSDMAKVLKIV